MCGLFAAKSKEDLLELAKLNIHRGSRTHSVSTFVGGELTIAKFDGEFNAENVPDKADYYICHIQAPTSQSAKAHPAIVGPINGKCSHVWHNGILKSDYMNDCSFKWDTAHIAEMMYHDRDIGTLDGSFACFHYQDGKLNVFRNEISPLFVGTDGQFSSTKTKLTPVALDANKVFNIELFPFTLTVVKEFKTLNNPYFFM
ncbi:nucleophile aminohydrolase [Vibrio phage 1.081.O._10N.286.52.C2]|nr:nucleophile aminohydrolase [Vibrio phage 1.081.O._10N.286.52.C2]